MGKLIYAMNVSLDGFVETSDHGLDWATIDDEIHGWWNDHERGLDASIYGRRLYEGMASHWPTAESDPDITPVMLDFARIWNAKPRIVFSHSLESVDANSRLVSGDVGDALAELKTEFSGDLAVGGATLAAQFIERGLVDEYRLVTHPVVLGDGTPFFPRLDRPIGLKLLATRVFRSGAIYQGYAATHE